MENSPSKHNIFNVNWAILHFVGVIDEVALLFPCGQNMLLCYMGGGGSEGLLCIPILHCSGHLDLITIKACLIISIQSAIIIIIVIVNFVFQLTTIRIKVKPPPRPGRIRKPHHKKNRVKGVLTTYQNLSKRHKMIWPWLN